MERQKTIRSAEEKADEIFRNMNVERQKVGKQGKRETRFARGKLRPVRRMV
jgi:hypothetical protein